MLIKRNIGNQLTRAEANRKNFRDQLSEKRSELTAAEDRMYKACGTQTYEATLTKLNTTVEKLQVFFTGFVLYYHDELIAVHSLHSKLNRLVINVEQNLLSLL